MNQNRQEHLEAQQGCYRCRCYLIEVGNCADIMFAVFSDSVFAGAPNPPVKLYETAEKKLGIRTSERSTTTIHAIIINR